MSLKTLANCVKRAKDGRLPAASGAGQRVIIEEQAEVSRLRREEVAELRMERDILRKATACLAPKNSCPVCVHKAMVQYVSGERVMSGVESLAKRLSRMADERAVKTCMSSRAGKK